MVNTCPAPRVNSNLLGQHVGNTVCVVGRVKGPAQGGMMYLEGADGGDIVIDRSSTSRAINSEYVEVVGLVKSDRTVEELRSTDFGSDFDLKMYNEVVLLSNGELKHIF